jgi:hypothetical protein
MIKTVFVHLKKLQGHSNVLGSDDLTSQLKHQTTGPAGKTEFHLAFVATIHIFDPSDKHATNADIRGFAFVKSAAIREI